MKPYSSELREKIVKIYEQGDTSIRKVAARLDVSKGFVQKILKQKQTTGHVQPKQQGGSLKSVLIPLLQKYATIARSAGKDNRMKVNYQERIEDTATELKIIMLQQRTVTNRQKVQALYLLKSGLSQSITDVAEILGVHRITVLAMVQTI